MILLITLTRQRLVDRIIKVIICLIMTLQSGGHKGGESEVEKPAQDIVLLQVTNDVRSTTITGSRKTPSPKKSSSSIDNALKVMAMAMAQNVTMNQGVVQGGIADPKPSSNPPHEDNEELLYLFFLKYFADVIIEAAQKVLDRLEGEGYEVTTFSSTGKLILERWKNLGGLEGTYNILKELYPKWKRNMIVGVIYNIMSSVWG